jgi:hypothetical protein
MSTNPLGKQKAEEVLKLLKPDSDKVDAARGKNVSVAKLYESLPMNLDKTDNITKTYNTGPIYTDLLKTNIDREFLHVLLSHSFESRPHAQSFFSERSQRHACA